MAVAVPFVIPAAEALWSAIVVVASAIATAVAVEEVHQGIANEFSTTAPVAVQACPLSMAKPGTTAIPATAVTSGATTATPPDCNEVFAKIIALRNELVERYAEMRLDAKGLYPIRPAAIPGIGSWPGHIQQFENKQTSLRRYLNLAAGMGCGPPPGDAWYWSSVSAPRAPAPRIGP